MSGPAVLICSVGLGADHTYAMAQLSARDSLWVCPSHESVFSVPGQLPLQAGCSEPPAWPPGRRRLRVVQVGGGTGTTSLVALTPPLTAVPSAPS